MTATKWYLWEVKDVLTNLIAVNILWYMGASNQHTLHLKPTMFFNFLFYIGVDCEES